MLASLHSNYEYQQILFHNNDRRKQDLHVFREYNTLASPLFELQIAVVILQRATNTRFSTVVLWFFSLYETVWLAFQSLKMYKLSREDPTKSFNPVKDVSRIWNLFKEEISSTPLKVFSVCI